MGTRNITFVVKDENKVVAQYCQWDGYPTGRGAEVLKFVSGLIASNKMDEFVRRIGLSYLNTTVSESRTYTGAPYDKAKRVLFDRAEKLQQRLMNADGEYHRLEECVSELLKTGKLTRKEADYLVVASRDTGNHVLDYLMENCPDGLAFWADEYILDMDLEGDWQIEGVYVINLDNGTVTIAFHGNIRIFTFNDLATMLDENIDDAMSAMESE